MIEPQKVMDAVKESGCEDAPVVFEISHREHYDTEFTVVADLQESVRYWRPYIEA